MSSTRRSLKKAVRARLHSGLDWGRAECNLFRHPRGVISYPKSGRTWLRVMLDELNASAVFSHANFRHPTQITAEVRREPRLYRRALVLLRDPRDVIVSAYHTHTKREHIRRDGLSDVIRDPVMGFERILHFNLLWAEWATREPHIGLMTYECLSTSGATAISDVLRFFGVKRSEDEVQRVFERNQLDKMREREAKGEYKDRYGKILMPRDPNDPDSFKVRKGQVGGYQDEMSIEDIRFCNELLHKLDYFSRITHCVRDYEAVFSTEYSKNLSDVPKISPS